MHKNKQTATATKKLTVNRETVRKLAVTLTDEQLQAAAGGMMGNASRMCGSSSTTAPC